MKIYTVTVCIDVSKTIDIKADSPEEAVQVAYEMVSLTDKLTTGLNFGDPYRAIVCDEDGTEIYDDSKNQ